MPSEIPPLICHPQEPTPDGFMEYTIESDGVPIKRDVLYYARFDERLTEAERMAELARAMTRACNEIDAFQSENEALRGIRGYLLDDLQWYGQERDRLLEVAKKAEGLTAELAQAQETNRRLNRRCQELESSDNKSLRHLDGASKSIWKLLHHLQENYRGSRNALNRIKARAQEMEQPEWVLIERLEKQRQQFGETVAREMKLRLGAEMDFNAAKAHCLQLEAELGRLTQKKGAGDADDRRTG